MKKHMALTILAALILFHATAVSPETPAKKAISNPEANSNRDWQKITQTITIGPDGTATGLTTIQLTGKPAIIAREIAKEILKLREDLKTQTVQYLLMQEGFNGTGALTTDDPFTTTEPFNIKVAYSIASFIPADNTAEMQLKPVVSLVFPVAKYFRMTYEPDPQKPILCFNLDTEEQYTYHFPNDTMIVSTPKNTKAETQSAKYFSTYESNGTVLRATRTLAHHAAREECKKQKNNTLDSTAQAIAKDIDITVLLKHLVAGDK